MIETYTVRTDECPTTLVDTGNKFEDILIRAERLENFCLGTQDVCGKVFLKAFEKNYNYPNRQGLIEYLETDCQSIPEIRVVSNREDKGMIVKRVLPNNEYIDKSIVNDNSIALLTFRLPPILRNSFADRWVNAGSEKYILKGVITEAFWFNLSKHKWLNMKRLTKKGDHDLPLDYFYVLKIDLTKNRYD